MPKNSPRRHDARRANRDRRARLEELRKAQRVAERRKNFLFAGSAIAVAIVLILAAVIPAYLHDQSVKAKNKAGAQAKPTAAEAAAGCDGVHNDPVSAAPTNSHLTTPIDYSKQKYGDTRGGTPPIPPTGGHHNPVSLGDTVRFYPLSEKPRPERAVHNLEHGYVVVWYDAKLPASDVKTLQALATNPAYSRLLVVGWYQGDLPANKHVVFTSWGRTDRCSSVSDTVAKAFYTAHLNASIAPEAGLGPISGADSYSPSTLPGSGAPTPAATTPVTTPTTSATSTATSTSPSPAASP